MTKYVLDKRKKIGKREIGKSNQKTNEKKVEKKNVKISKQNVIFQMDRVLTDMSQFVSGMTRDQLSRVVGFFNEGFSLPFIARYKQKETGSIDEQNLRQIDLQFPILMEVESTRVACISKITELKDIDIEMKEILIQQIVASGTVSEIKSLMPKNNMKETKLRQALADSEAVDMIEHIRSCFAPTCSHLQKIFPSLRAHLETLVSALWILKDLDMRNLAYSVLTKHCFYFRTVRPHQWLADKRAGTNKYTLSNSAIDDLLNHFFKALAPNSASRSAQPHSCLRLVMDGFRTSITDYLLPAVKRSWTQQLDAKAELEAMEYFKVNLRHKLLQPGVPSGGLIMGIDPGLASGCKAVILNGQDHIVGTGKFNSKTIPINIDGFKAICGQFNIRLIVLGDGTGSLECQMFLAHLLPDIPVCIVSESGASRYSISELGMEELPNMPVEYRGAVSIARRAIDPLSEYCKIDPQHLSVGMYQHDLKGKELEKNLAKIVSECVALVGIDINTASESVLRCVPGLNKSSAKAIIQYRESTRKFENRHEVLQVKGIGPVTWTHCIGFLQVKNSTWTPLDCTCVHPDDYAIANQIVKTLPEFRHLVSPNIPIYNGEVSLDMQKQILELLKPENTDEEPMKIQQAKTLGAVTELVEGAVVNGTVSNITAFGAFVSLAACGCKEDGLLHVSQYPLGIRDPHFYKINQTVQVKVVKITTENVMNGNKSKTKLKIGLSSRI